ncbi:MAG: PD-(D/E)XK nuclease family protein [Clostridiales Family XIII bacterium]|jgi:ATP-dependent helicase/nuclease subunit B|nr:PD-(D/E)XK nuclease family protein [Clostridiales Family XIII bacterium]
MLKIINHNAHTDVMRFIADGIHTSDAKEKIVIVPEQSKVSAERDVTYALGTKGLMHTEILSISRLAARIYHETGGGRDPSIDEFEKYMLLSYITGNREEELEIYKGLEMSSSFLNALAATIGELKNSGITPEMLPDGESDMLSKKLRDVRHVYTAYNQILESRAVSDSVDKLLAIRNKLDKSNYVKNCEIWIYGFDYFTSVQADVLLDICRYAKGMHILLTGGREDDCFRVTADMSKRLRALAKNLGANVEIVDISDTYALADILPEFRHIERYLYADVNRNSTNVIESASEQDSALPHVEIVHASSPYAEAQDAAIRISKLVRDEHFRYRDILVITNDRDAKLRTLKRVFDEYNIPAFMDMRRSIDKNPASVLLLSMLACEAYGYKTEDIFSAMDTGLFFEGKQEQSNSFSRLEFDDIYDYAVRYKLRGLTAWSKPLRYGKKEYGETRLAALDTKRALIYEELATWHEALTGKRTCQSIVDGLSAVLSALYARTNQLADSLNVQACNTDDHQQDADDLMTYASEMLQAPAAIDKILSGLKLVLTDTKLSMKEFLRLTKTGLSQIDIGIVPPSIDQVTVGTMLRTRTSGVKAVFVLHATEDILPLSHSPQTLFSDSEIYEMSEMGLDIGNASTGLTGGEELAIYNNLSKPSEYLYLSYSPVGGKNGEPAEVVLRIQQLLHLQLHKDIASQPDLIDLDMIQTRHTSKAYFLNAVSKLRDDLRYGQHGKQQQTRGNTNSANHEFRLLQLLYNELYQSSTHTPIHTKNISLDAFLQSEDIRIGALRARKLLTRNHDNEIKLSPSGLEQYSKCPFAFLMSRGLRLREKQDTTVNSMDIGNLVHESMAKYALFVLNKGYEEFESRQVSQQAMHEIFEEVAANYGDEILSRSAYDSYKKRRVARLLEDAAWVMPASLASMDIVDVQTEVRFGDDISHHSDNINTINADDTNDTNDTALKHGGSASTLPAIKLGGASIEGIIDRVDILASGSVGITDYKTGAAEYNPAWAISGWQQQLIVYLKAASVGLHKDPQYAYYQKIPDNLIDIKDTGHVTADHIKQELVKAYKQDGESRDSRPYQMDEKVYDFEDVMNLSWETIESHVTDLTDGIFDIKPMRKPQKWTQRSGLSKSKETETACTYCDYKTLCKHI